ncbi:peroxisomal leader peptide-processing protease-like [Columba livia]|uniref:Peroxisomal leader peptide-processing protease n=1 Tax=Columba livia TaxID=8932 RepID=A0A2I0MRM9_COLLI|nr:peroxisomal leader peptide-processing protease-like [Columba livia]
MLLLHSNAIFTQCIVDPLRIIKNGLESEAGHPAAPSRTMASRLPVAAFAPKQELLIQTAQARLFCMAESPHPCVWLIIIDMRHHHYTLRIYPPDSKDPRDSYPYLSHSYCLAPERASLRLGGLGHRRYTQTTMGEETSRSLNKMAEEMPNLLQAPLDNGRRSQRAEPPAASQPPLRLHVLHPSAGTRVPALSRDAPAASRSPAGALQQHEAQLLALLPCRTFQKALAQAFGQAEQWRFGGEAAGADPRALHWFAWLRVPGLDTPAGGWTARASAGCLRKGQALRACGSPFGALCPDLFLNTLSKGVVSNMAGEENALLLTDARCLPGTEGGGAFLPSATGSRLVGWAGAGAAPWRGKERAAAALSSLTANVAAPTQA